MSLQSRLSLFQKRPLLILSVLYFCLFLYVRLALLPLYTDDIPIFMSWIRVIESQGGWSSLGQSVSNYPPAYLYVLLSSLSLWGNWGEVLAIKLQSLPFELFATFMIYRIARLKFPQGDTAYFLAALFWGLPTIALNGAAWGQVDMLYVSFLIACVYFLLVERPFWGVVAFSVAFCFKSQSIFLLPFLGILVLKRKIPWYYFLLTPLIYVLCAIPVILMGRSWLDVLTIYIYQVSQYRRVSMNAPNLYIFLNGLDYEKTVLFGLVFAALGMLAWAVFTLRRNLNSDPRLLSLLALLSAGLVPFLLPKMHDRYFLAADALAFVLAIFNPEMWFIPILYQIISGSAYLTYLFSFPRILVFIGALVNIGTAIYLLRKQRVLSQPKS